MKRLGVVVLAILGPAAAFAQTPVGGSVSGDIYLMTKNGDVKKGAANQVYLLKNHSGLAAHFTALCAEQSSRFKRHIYEDSIRLAAMPAPSKERVEMLEIQIKSVLDFARLDHEEQRGLLRSAAWRSSPTGMAAHYTFADVPPGRYWLVAMMTVGEESRDWLLPVTVVAGQSGVIDLDNNNAAQPWNCDHPSPID